MVFIGVYPLKYFSSHLSNWIIPKYKYALDKLPDVYILSNLFYCYFRLFRHVVNAWMELNGGMNSWGDKMAHLNALTQGDLVTYAYVLVKWVIIGFLSVWYQAIIRYNDDLCDTMPLSGTLITCVIPSHHQVQWWPIVNWTLRNKLLLFASKLKMSSVNHFRQAIFDKFISKFTEVSSQGANWQ